MKKCSKMFRTFISLLVGIPFVSSPSIAMVDDSNTEKLSLDRSPKERLLNASLLIGIDLDYIVTMFTDLLTGGKVYQEDVNPIFKKFDGIKEKFKHIDLNTVSELDDMDYAFLCANFFKCSSTIETILKYFNDWHQFKEVLCDIQDNIKKILENETMKNFASNKVNAWLIQCFALNMFFG